MPTETSQPNGKRIAFIDMNAFFASCEQQERPELRGRPVAVVPLRSDSTCAIAASYEAKALGIKTGTPVREALRLCPRIALVEARPKVYMEYNQGIHACLRDFFVDIKPLSIDEMACAVGRLDCSEEGEVRLGRAVKKAIRDRLGDWMRCSVGIAPNIFLAKVASDMRKPDGLVRIDPAHLPHALYQVPLNDLPGIGRQMYRRLLRWGITTVEHLYQADLQLLRRVWGSVEGPRWYYMLRGSADMDYRTWQDDRGRKTVGHSHVLPPEYRSRKGAQDVLLRLFTRCTRRLRHYGLSAASVGVWARLRHEQTFTRETWKLDSRRHLHANDETSWIKIVRPMIDQFPDCEDGSMPLAVGVTFWDLQDSRDVTLNLFDDTFARAEVSRTMDKLNHRREGSVQIASVLPVQRAAPFRIAFGRQFEAFELAQAE